MKGMAGSVSAFFNWTIAFTVTKFFHNMLTVFGSGLTFGIFSVICGVGTVFVLLMVPETKGKDIGEIQQILMGKAAQNRQCCEINCDEHDDDDDGVTINIKK